MMAGSTTQGPSSETQGQSPPRSQSSPKLRRQSQSPTSQGHSPPSQGQSSPPRPLAAESTLEADDTASIAQDSAYNDSVGHSSYVTSLKSNVANYIYENGRRYHAFRPGTYLVPNDDEEQDRMDLIHHVFRLLTGGPLFFAPISDHPQRVLDLGTGTGIWAMDFADEYPSAEVVGIDLSPIQPKWTPPNCVFEVDDYEDEWLYRRPFDFIHGRELEGCIANDEQLLERAFKNLTPGGYMELQATAATFTSGDGTHEKATNTLFYVKTIHEGAAKFGKPLDIATQWKTKMENAGFTDVEEKLLKLPVGTWPKDPKLKELGGLQQYQQFQALDSYTPGMISRMLDWTDAETQVLIAKVKSELKDPSHHIYVPVHFVWGRKPL